MNEFETHIDEHKDSIGDIATDYLNISGKPDIIDDSFYKLWEILMMYDVINDDKGITTAHFANGSVGSVGSDAFTQSTMLYRNMFYPKQKDKHHTLVSHEKSKFIEYYEKNKQLHLYKGDITEPKIIKQFCDDVNEKVDFITAICDVSPENENLQEQFAWKTIFAQIVTATKLMKKNGCFVCKYYETFSKTSIKTIALLKTLYKNVTIIKPFTSKPSDSEKIVLCVDFKYSPGKELDNIIKKLDNMIVAMYDKKKYNVVDIFGGFDVMASTIPEFREAITKMNNMNSNKQFKYINIFIKYFNLQNFHGEQYQVAREKQIVANKFWIDLFFPEKDNVKELDKLKKYALEQNI